MATWTPDPTFYPSPRLAADAPPEKLAYVASFDPARRRNDEMAVVDLNDRVAGLRADRWSRRNAGTGDELHHFGWNACSSCLCPNVPHPHVERRYLIVPGLRSSRIHILDTKPDPKNPKIVRVIQPAEIVDRAGYTRPHIVHCGPDGIYISALGNAEGKAPGGILLMDHETFDVLGRWEVDRGPQELAYDMWWHLGHDTMVTSEWGTPDMFENGLVPELLLAGKYGHKLDPRQPVGTRAEGAPHGRGNSAVDVGDDQYIVWRGSAVTGEPGAASNFGRGGSRGATYCQGSHSASRGAHGRVDPAACRWLAPCPARPVQRSGL
jgi:selenium-binding protein 1